MHNIQVIGHQHKQSRVDLFNSPPSWIERSIVLKGRRSSRKENTRGWEYWNKHQVVNLLGHSLRRLYPISWPNVTPAHGPMLRVLVPFPTDVDDIS
jgi:hypothetical protein